MNLKTENSTKTKLPLVSFSLLFIYPILVCLDLYTTYIASPDLKYETNIIINRFNMSWISIIISVIAYMCLCFFIILRNNYLIYSRNINLIKITITILVVIMFYCHFSYSTYVIFNNYLSYIYLFGSSNLTLNKFSISYVEYYQNNLTWYNYFMYLITFIIGLTITTLRVLFICSSKKRQNE